MLRVDTPLSHYNTFGIIVEIQRPVRKAKGEKFKTMIRVIDGSFNYKMAIDNKSIHLTKFVQLNIYTETYSGAPHDAHIGDIIRLK